MSAFSLPIIFIDWKKNPVRIFPHPLRLCVAPSKLMRRKFRKKEKKRGHRKFGEALENTFSPSSALLKKSDYLFQSFIGKLFCRRKFGPKAQVFPQIVLGNFPFLFKGRSLTSMTKKYWKLHSSCSTCIRLPEKFTKLKSSSRDRRWFAAS